MNRVRVKDLALVAVAGGLLAFELVTIGEALPEVTKALVERGLPAKVEVASAGVAAVPLPAVEPTASMPSQAVARAMERRAKASQTVARTVESHAHRLAASTAAAGSKRCATLTRAREARRDRAHRQLLTVVSDRTGTVESVTLSATKIREIEKAVQALKQSTL